MKTRQEETSATKEGWLHAESCLSDPSLWPLPGRVEESKAGDVYLTGLTSVSKNVQHLESEYMNAAAPPSSVMSRGIFGGMRRQTDKPS